MFPIAGCATNRTPHRRGLRSRWRSPGATRLGQLMNETKGIVPGFSVYRRRPQSFTRNACTGPHHAQFRRRVESCRRWHQVLPAEKDHPKYAGHDLLIEAPLHSLPKERWRLIEDDLRSAASALPFREIHVIGDHDQPLFGLRRNNALNIVTMIRVATR